jgi:hypothetical protein
MIFDNAGMWVSVKVTSVENFHPLIFNQSVRIFSRATGPLASEAPSCKTQLSNSFMKNCKLIPSSITSRKFYNFTNDAHRTGQTIKPFNARESWLLLMKLLGPDWVDNDRKGLIKASEQRAAEELLKSLNGVREMTP